VAITRQTPGGKEVWVRNLREGDFFGEFGFFTDQKRHASVKAIKQCEILEISLNELNELMKTYPRLKEALQNLFKQRVLDLFLACSPLFSSLTAGERENVFKRFHLLKVPQDTLLFKGGEPSQSLYMIKSGEVEIFIQDRRKRRTALATLRSGNFFGEIGVVMNKPRMAFAKTTQPSELLELTKEDLETCLLKFPQLKSIMKEISSKRLVQMKELLSQEGVEKAREVMV
jgi:CRP-like cAMP-binding protein